MIRTEEGNLVLVPRAFEENNPEARQITIPLERGFKCPHCETLIYGAFKTERDHTHLVNLNLYSNQDGIHAKPEYVNEFIELPGGNYQFFFDKNHAGEGMLVDRVKETAYNRCKYLKFYYEPNYRRLLERVVKDLSGLSLYGITVNGRYLPNHAEILKACVEKTRYVQGRMWRFLDQHPYGKFVGNLAGGGPEGYQMMYRGEQNLLHNYYRSFLLEPETDV